MKEFLNIPQINTQIADAVFSVEEGNDNASAVYKTLHTLKKMCEEAMKEPALTESLKQEVADSGKGYDFGGFTIAHTVRQTFTPQIDLQLLEWEGLIKEAKKSSQDCAKKGKVGAVVMSNDGEQFEVLPATLKSASDVFTIKVLKS